MARFILDVDIYTAEEVKKVLDIIERDEQLAGTISTITCIDVFNENQFYDHDTDTTPEMNGISDRQVKKHRDYWKKVSEDDSNLEKDWENELKKLDIFKSK